MKFEFKIITLVLVLGSSVTARVVTESETPVVDSEKMLGLCLESIQRQYFPVSLPSLTERLLQPAGSFPVDWDSFSPETRKHFQGWIDDDGIVRYAVGLYEDYWTGEIVVLNDLGGELFRISREKGYDPYDYQRAFFYLGKKDFLEDEFTRMVFHPSKIATVVELVPLVFWDAHLQVEQELAAQELSAVPMMMAMSSSGTTKPMAHMTEATNGVNLEISLPLDFGRYIEIFRRDDLIIDSWSVADSWIPTFGNTTVVWNDPTASDKRFYHISNAVDSDGDGFSDLREAWGSTVTGSNVFNTVNNDGDSMHDWFELKIFGDLDESDSDDFDGDGLLNSEEMIYFPDAPPSIFLVSDPSLYDTDDDGLNDFDEVRGVPPTDPWNPDVSAPALSMSPTSGTVITP